MPLLALLVEIVFFHAAILQTTAAVESSLPLLAPLAAFIASPGPILGSSFAALAGRRSSPFLHG